MKAIWLEFPDYERGSLGWRMGPGESYIRKWQKFYKNLSIEQREEYRIRYPEPIGWEGFYG